MEMMNAPGMGYAATRIVGVLFDRLITRSVISYAEANAILDDAIALIRCHARRCSPVCDLVAGKSGRLGRLCDENRSSNLRHRSRTVWHTQIGPIMRRPTALGARQW